jgi:hypothetical protein
MEHEDVQAILQVLFDIRTDVRRRIVVILQDDEQEGNEEADS